MEVLKSYLASLAKPDEQDKVIAYSTMGQTISAFKWYVKTKMKNGKLKEAHTEAVAGFTSAFYKGFKNDIAQRKLDGKMGTKEGKILQPSKSIFLLLHCLRQCRILLSMYLLCFAGILFAVLIQLQH